MMWHNLLSGFLFRLRRRHNSAAQDAMGSREWLQQFGGKPYTPHVLLQHTAHCMQQQRYYARCRFSSTRHREVR